jgi:hypothetical protein
MTPYRGSDEALDREISAVEHLVRVRLRRANDDLRDLETILRDLRKERRRRRQTVIAPAETTLAVDEAIQS